MTGKTQYAKDAEFRDGYSNASKADRHAYLANRDPDEIAEPHDKHTDKQVEEVEKEEETEETE